MSNPECVRVLLPTVQGVPCDAEVVWAEPRDLPAGRYEVVSVTWMADGVSFGDTVRCDVAGDGSLVAVEVVERSPHATVVFGLTDETLPDDLVTCRILDLDAAIQDLLELSLPSEGGPGILSVLVPPDRLGEVLEVALEGSVSRERDDGDRIIGDWTWDLASHPWWPTGQRLRGSSRLLERDVELVGVSWTGDDPVAARWHSSVRTMLREQAAIDPGLRRLLDERRYLAALAPIVRMALAEEFGFAAVGDQPFPTDPTDPTGPTGPTAPTDPTDPLLDPDLHEQEFRRQWEAAHDGDGRVRWCDDETLNAVFRDVITRLGLDPDADPRLPC